jgi:hypothetical protein
LQIPVKRMMRTRGALVAAITALGVGLTILVSQVLGRLIEATKVIDSGTELAAIPGPFDNFGVYLLATTLPFTIGYFLALWAFAPITEQLRIGHVITRSILVTGIATTVMFVISALVHVTRGLAAAYPLLLDVSTPSLVGMLLLEALRTAGISLIALLPLGVLGGVLQWVWRTGHPSEHHIEGLIDV